MAKITKRMKKDGSCSYCIRVSNGYDRRGRQVMVNRTFTPPPGMTGKKLEKELQRQADAFEQEVHAGVLLDASMKVDDLIERWFTEYAEKKLKPKTVYNYWRLVPRISAGLGQLKVCQVKPAHLMAFYSNLEAQGVREDSTYTATPALLERLPHGKRGQIAKAAGIGDDTMRNVYRGANVSQSTAEKVAGVVGLPFSKAFTEHTNASLLIAAHVPVTAVSSRLGHAKTSTATDIYAGFIRSADAAASDALTDVFARIRDENHA